MSDYREIERIVKEVLHSSDYVFYQDGDSLKFNGDIIYNPKPIEGPEGKRGFQGPVGQKGEEGAKGQTGPKGPKGDSGESIKGDKGDKGENGKDGITPYITCTASVDNTEGIPNCVVTRSGTITEPIFNFRFSGLKGSIGNNGSNGKDGKDGKNGIDGRDGKDGLDADNTEVIRLINEVENRLNQQKTRIDEFVNQLDSEINSSVKELLQNAQWWKQNFPSGQTGGSSNFGQQDVQEYLQQLGLWYQSDNETYTKWSTINQKVDNVTLEVNQIKQTSTDYEALSGSLYSYLTGKTITSGLRSTWAKFLDDDKLEMLEWITAGVEAQANDEESVAELFASAKGQGESAYAGIDARVRAIEGSYVSETNLSTKVNNSINSLVQQSTRYNSFSEMSSSVDSSIAGISTEVDSKLKTAIINMFAKGESGTAAISAIVDDNNKLTHVELQADQINIFDSNNKEVARISNQGRCSFNQGRVFIPTTVQGISGNTDTNATGIVIQEVSNGSLTGKKAYYQGNGFNVQSSSGSIYCSVANTSGRNVELVSYLDSTDSYSKRITFAVDSQNSTTNAPRIQAYVAPSLAEACGGNYGTFETNMSIVCPEINQSSDESLKNIINNVNLSVEDISEVRVVNYTFKNQPKNIRSGTIAQDWLEILPNVVKVIDKDSHLGLDYSSAALISSVVDAREIVKLKQENKELKERLAIIEAKLNI